MKIFDDQSQSQKAHQEPEPSTRRDFLTRAAAASAVAASAAMLSRKSDAQTASGSQPAADCEPIAAPVRPPEIERCAAITATRAEFSGKGMTGAQLFANLCKDEELAAFFLCPGNYSIANELAQVGIPTFGGRTEGGMCAMGDGFSRASNEVVACSGTEGPGFCHMTMNIAAAHFANTPMLVLASNATMGAEDSQTFLQFMMQQPVTSSIRKYGKRIIMPTRIYEYGATAFRQIRTGVPGLAHLDFPRETYAATFKDASEVVRMYSKNQYRSDTRPAPSAKEMALAVSMITKAERPVLVAGHGVYWRQASELLLKTAERHEMCIVGSGPTRGHFPDDHRLDGSRSTSALMSADLVVFVGQYLMPSVGDYTFPVGVPTIRVHPEQGDLGHNWPIDLGIVSDEKLFLEALGNALSNKKRAAWVDEIASAKKKQDEKELATVQTALGYSQSTGLLHPSTLCKEVHDFLYTGSIDPKQTLTGYGSNLVGAHAGRWLRGFRPGQEIITYYQFGAMGPDLAMMIGGGAAVKAGLGAQKAYKGAPTVVITGDAGMGFTLMELDTATKYKIPVICVVYNNNCWGMQFTAKQTPKAEQLYMFQENIRYDKIAEVLGARGEYCKTQEQLRDALGRAYQAAERDNVSTLINCQGHKDFSLSDKYPGMGGFGPEPGVRAQMH
jgi:thiamine pyrophosphate-dependent acetolactate synthase large subunit-like protein